MIVEELLLVQSPDIVTLSWVAEKELAHLQLEIRMEHHVAFRVYKVHVVVVELKINFLSSRRRSFRVSLDA